MSHGIERRGLMMVLSSPSGAGKTTISRKLLQSEPQLKMSVSVTTRPPRPGEVEGRDYFFITPEQFGLMVNRRELLEHAKVFSNHYGTPKGPVAEALALGRDVLFDIDWQGTQQLVEHAREDVISIFILPPSTRELERRLRQRAQDPADVVAARMAKASDEISHWAEYDYVVLNEDLEKTLLQVQSILHAERLRRRRQTGLGDFVKRLRDGV
ncbi:guanylate kinase [Oleomonas cavernae]|uniref:Guanylate kinase n=1 Tax=Oleomonas cavernae TaxID=2320859 RepID=A0A418WAC3_9PROT|nr:guanylate kinase [Oleomonas cavernae]RJF86904.1 guanylate kinase [Oleomonas cavernae]